MGQDEAQLGQAAKVAVIGPLARNRQVARRLLQLEADTEWSAVRRSWARQRGRWVASLQSI